MSSNIYILCPGQGAQVVGMGQDYFQRCAASRAVFEAANDILGYDLATLCFQGPAEKLDQTDVSQPAIYVTSAACMAAVTETSTLAAGVVPIYAGLSLGEYTALHLAGALGFADGLKLVQARGRYMQEAGRASAGGMVSIVGATEEQVRALCQTAAQGEVLVPANFNAPGQIVVSGAAAACARVAQAAEVAGLRAIPLRVSGAFHSPLMQPAADRMAAELKNTPLVAPKAVVYANVTAAPHGEPESIKRLLVDQIVKPVRWEQTMAAILAAEPEAKFVELAPGRVLTGLLRKLQRRAEVNNLASAEAVLGAA